MGKELVRARAYEEEAEKRIDKNERPAFHLSARTGWMNVPNGFPVMGADICFINIIRMVRSGCRCTGDTQ